MENLQYINSINEQIISNQLSNHLKILPISPWGRFVSSLNAAVLEARELNYPYIIFQSFEFHISPENVQHLSQLFSDPNTLVVGPEMDGHDFYSPPSPPSEPPSNMITLSIYRHVTHLNTSSSSSSSFPSSLFPTQEDDTPVLKTEEKEKKSNTENKETDNNNDIISYPGYSVPVRGRTIPWNTFSIWSLPLLSLTGFLLVSDGVLPPPPPPQPLTLNSNSNIYTPLNTNTFTSTSLSSSSFSHGGVEEVVAINLLQSLQPNLKAYLVRLPASTSPSSSTSGSGSSSSSSGKGGLEWETSSFSADPQRVIYHQEKMRSKDERPRIQMKALRGLKEGTLNQGQMASSSSTSDPLQQHRKITQEIQQQQLLEEKFRRKFVSRSLSTRPESSSSDEKKQSTSEEDEYELSGRGLKDGRVIHVDLTRRVPTSFSSSLPSSTASSSLPSDS